MGWFNAPPLEGGGAAYESRTGFKAPAEYCRDECKHGDCAEVRAYYRIGCYRCGEGFVAGNPVYVEKAPTESSVNGHVWIHAHCAEEK